MIHVSYDSGVLISKDPLNNVNYLKGPGVLIHWNVKAPLKLYNINGFSNSTGHHMHCTQWVIIRCSIPTPGTPN